jgi:RNase P subunit RPR2
MPRGGKQPGAGGKKPRYPKGWARTRGFNRLFNQFEIDIVEKAALAEGMSLAEYIRGAALSRAQENHGLPAPPKSRICDNCGSPLEYGHLCEIK